MNTVKLLRAMLASGGSIEAFKPFIEKALAELEWAMKLRAEDAALRITRLQDEVNALICNGFQFNSQGIYEEPNPRIEVDWMRGDQTRRLVEAFHPREKDHMRNGIPFDRDLTSLYFSPDATNQICRLLAEALAPHILAAVCDSMGKDEAAARIRETLDKHRKKYCHV